MYKILINITLSRIIVLTSFVYSGIRGMEATMAITDEQLGNWFTYHSPDAEQLPKYKVIREAGLMLAATILKNTPASADQTAAIRKVREAVMTANAAIACKGM